jgi:hypothetical protein
LSVDVLASDSSDDVVAFAIHLPVVPGAGDG